MYFFNQTYGEGETLYGIENRVVFLDDSTTNVSNVQAAFPASSWPMLHSCLVGGAETGDSCRSAEQIYECTGDYDGACMESYSCCGVSQNDVERAMLGDCLCSP